MFNLTFIDPTRPQKKQTLFRDPSAPRVPSVGEIYTSRTKGGLDTPADFTVEVIGPIKTDRVSNAHFITVPVRVL